MLATTTHDLSNYFSKNNLYLETPLNAIMCMIDESMLCIEKS